MGGGELHLESSRQPGHSKEAVWCRHNSKEDHLSDLKVESAMICSLEIEHHGKSPQIKFSSQGHIEINIMQKNSSYKRKVQLISLFVFVLSTSGEN